MLGEQSIEVGVVNLQFLTGVAPVMLAVGVRHLRIDVEPVLHSLGEVLHVVRDAVGVVEDAGGFGFLVALLQPTVEVRLGNHQADAMDGVCELMDEDVLGMIFVNLISQHILLSAGCQRFVDGASEPSGTQVPVQGGVVDQIAMLGDVRGALVAGHDGHAGVSLDHGLQHLGLQHTGHGIQRPVGSHEGRVRNAPGRDERQAIHIHVLHVEGIQSQGIRDGADDALRHLKGSPAPVPSL